MNYIRNFVDGQFFPEEGATSSADFFAVQYPQNIGPQFHIYNTKPIDVIKALQSCKKSFYAPVKPALEERVRLIQFLQAELNSQQSEIARRLAEIESLPVQEVIDTQVFAIHKLLQERLSELENYTNKQASAVGVVSIILPATAALVYLFKAFVPAYLTGNYIVIKCSHKNPVAGQIFAELLALAHSKFDAKQFVPGSVQIIHGKSDSVGELFYAHPAARTVCAWAHLPVAEKIAAEAVKSGKKLHIGSGFNNSAFVLQDLNEQQLQLLTESCFLGLGQYPWNISKVFVLESLLEKFTEAWQSYFLNKYSQQCSLRESSRIEHYHALCKQLSSERGKLLFGGRFEQNPSDPSVFLDLTHCSTLQQDQLDCPLVIVSPVKYLHEMSKWANTSYLGQYALVFAEETKARNLAAKLDYGWIDLNKPQVGEFLASAKHTGFKQSFYGISDLSLSSDLFSDFRQTWIEL